MTISITGRAVPSAEERNRLFHTYVEPNINGVRRLVASLTYVGEDADDNLQDVLIMLLNAIPFYDPAKAGITSWLDRVVRNAMIDIHRRGRRQVAAVSLDVLLDGLDGPDNSSPDAEAPDPCNTSSALVAPPDSAPSLPPLVIEREDYPLSYDALMALPALQRRALLLSTEGWSCADVAAELRLSEANVRKMLSRAKATLAARLQESRIVPKAALVS